MGSSTNYLIWRQISLFSLAVRQFVKCLCTFKILFEKSLYVTCTSLVYIAGGKCSALCTTLCLSHHLCASQISRLRVELPLPAPDWPFDAPREASFWPCSSELLLFRMLYELRLTWSNPKRFLNVQILIPDYLFARYARSFTIIWSLFISL